MDSTHQPLAGKQIVVTRARSQAGRLAQELEDLGAEVIEFPTIEICAPEVPFNVEDFDSFDWVIFTSTNTLTHFASGLESSGKSIKQIQDAKICAVGPATAEALRDFGLEVHLVPQEFTADALIDALKQHDEDLAGKHFLLPRGDLADSTLPDGLRALGAHATELIVYRTRRPETSDEAVAALLGSQPDVVTFTSASTAQNFVDLLGTEGIRTLATTAVYASIGPMTSLAALERGLSIEIEPEQHDVPHLVAALIQWSKAP